MKPRNKEEHRVQAISDGLKPLSLKQEQWCYNKPFEHFAFKNKKNECTCMECGHTFISENKHNVCSSCNTKLTIIHTRKHNVSDQKYVCKLEVVNEFQVIRIFSVIQKYHKGKKADYYFRECVRHFIYDSGSYRTFAMNHNFSYYYQIDPWIGKLELKDYRNFHNVYADALLPNPKYKEFYKKRGFTGILDDVSPLNMFTELHSNPYFETLLKAKKYHFLSYYQASTSEQMSIIWPSIKICIRNNYEPHEVSIWDDYIKYLIRFKKDIRNFKYVCPNDLHAEHNKYVNLKKALDEKENIRIENERRIREKLKFDEAVKVFEQKSKFFDISIKNKDLEIVVLDSIEEYKLEADTMNHCVYDRQYFGKPESLVLSARIKGNRTETIELSLKSFKVIQSYGYCNNVTKYNKRIINTVEKNSHLFKNKFYQTV